MEEIKVLKKIPEFAGVTCDSRQVKPGYAFVAIAGFHQDGNKYIDDAINNGAQIIFTEKELKIQQDIPVVKVKDTRSLLGNLAARFYGYPSLQLNLIGVTGTNGKTTTTHMIYQLLNFKTDQKKSGLIGTVKVDTGKRTESGDLTTPPPVKMQKLLREMIGNKLQHVCMEVSSHGIELKRIAGCKFAIKVGTNISLDHVDLHPNLNEYIQVKRSFLECNKCQLVIINGDDPYLNSFGKISNYQINYGIINDVEIKARNISKWQMGSQFTYQLNKTLRGKGQNPVPPCQFPIRMKMPGDHNIYNALVATTIALFYGVEIERVQEFFETFPGVWRRLQQIYNDKFTIIDDCAHNPGSYSAVFNAVKKMDYQKLIVVNSLRGNRGTKINEKNAETISQNLAALKNYHLFTSNCTDVVKPIDLVSWQEEEVFLDTLKTHNINYRHYPELEPALKKALCTVAADDLILILGPHSMDQAGDMMLRLIK